jgi:hypothetical protein
MEQSKHELSRQLGMAGTLGRALAFVGASVLSLMLPSWDASLDGRGGGVNIGAGFAVTLVTVAPAAFWVAWTAGAAVMRLSSPFGGQRWRSSPAWSALRTRPSSWRRPACAASAPPRGAPGALTAALIFVPAAVSGVNAMRARPEALAVSR